jgi:PAS domain-containing protein
VRTYCISVSSSSSSTSRPVGLACVDVLERIAIHEEKDPGSGVITLTDHVHDFTLFDADVGESGEILPLHSEQISDLVVSGIRGLSADLKDAAVFREIPRGGRATSDFLVNLGPSDNEGLQRFAYVQPAAYRMRPTYLQIAGVVAIFISLILLAMSSSYASRINIESERGAVLQNLQVGVLQLDEERRVEYANDRAEEILDRRLRKFGQSRPAAGADRILFEQMVIGDKLVLEGEAGAVGSTVVSMRHINELRKQGVASGYFARVASADGNGAWIKVSASPMMPGRAGQHEKLDRRTFGVIEEVTDSTARELDLVAGKSSSEANGRDNGLSESEVSRLRQMLGQGEGA